MSSKRRKQQKGPSKRARQTMDLAQNVEDHIESSDSEDETFGREPSLQEEEASDEEEDLDVKKVRLAREYLQNIEARSDEPSEEDEKSGEEDDDEEKDVVGLKLQRQRLQREGTFERPLASRMLKHVTALKKSIVEERPALLSPDQAADQWVKSGHVKLLSGHDLTPTCVAVQGTTAISGSKDHSVFVWDIETQSRKATLCRHWRKNKETISRSDGQVLAVALSDRFAAVGKRDGLVSIFDIRSNNELLKTFEGHKGAVTSLAFRTQSNQLFSASEDRCIRHYNLDEMLYMETLYGHQFGITAIDCHRKERPISVGKDRTVRAWKLAEDTHLIFRGGSKIQSAQAVSLLKDDWFLTGHQDGHLSLWMSEKKKAVATIEHAHGEGNEVVSVAALKGSDVVASGSNDGYLRLWKAMTGRNLQDRGLEPLCQIPVRGYINDIAFGPKGKFCVLAIGQEHRCGRWARIPGAKNRIAIVNLQSSLEMDDDPSEEEMNEPAPEPSESEQSDSD